MALFLIFNMRLKDLCHCGIFVSVSYNKMCWCLITRKIKCIEVSDANLFRSYFMLHQIDVKFLGKNYKPTSYTLTDLHCPFLLTEKQENCLFLLIRGKTIKEIAKMLKVSPRTIESHFVAIKTKLNCDYNAELIEKAIDSGFLYYVPKNFQNGGLEKIISMIKR